MQPDHSLHIVPPAVQFVDHSSLQWENVRRTQYWMYQRFRYQYPGPVRDLHQRLIIVPLSQHGDQHLSGYKLRVVAQEVTISSSTDVFGNHVYYVDMPLVDSDVEFETWSSVERIGLKPPAVPDEQVDQFLEFTTLTNPDLRLEEAAASLQQSANDPWTLAEQINSWVYQTMKYASGQTNVATTAAEALRIGQGLCQDYAHIMLTICRLAGLPARYVSGHLLGEGGSHAWVEVILPAQVNSGAKVAVAFDPTNHCRAGMRHITVAIGRDYRDVSPTSGYFTAPYQGHLTTSKRAGLVRVEYSQGQTISIDEQVLSAMETSQTGPCTTTYKKRTA